MLGGTFEVVDDVEHLRCSDGRLIPFSYLSSGQQEVMPLVRTIDFLLESTGEMGMVYIEEPEAHLFPEAQSQLVSFLASLLFENAKDTLFLTTHSPYVLSKLNNLLKAGQIVDASGASDKGHKVVARVEQIMHGRNWIKSNDVTAYAIENRNTVDLKDETGLISTDYIDRISDEMALQYNLLLGVQYQDAEPKNT
jgi:hypothetical protein